VVRTKPKKAKEAAKIIGSIFLRMRVTILGTHGSIDKGVVVVAVLTFAVGVLVTAVAAVVLSVTGPRQGHAVLYRMEV
jgi:hypothetical protein